MRGNTQICQLLEMAVYDESDVFEKEPVASINSQSIPKIEGGGYCEYVYNKIKDIVLPENYQISTHILGAIYCHHVAGDILKRAALLALPYIINANYIISPWKKGHNKPQMAGMIAAPILIDGNKYLCCVTLLKNAQRVIKPYAIALKDKCGNNIEKEVANDINVLDNDKVFSRRSLPHGNADMSQDASTLLEYRKQIMCQNNTIKKNSKIKNNDMSDRKFRRSDVIARDNREKKVTRISRQRLKGLIEEAVENIINEGYAETKDDIDYLSLYKKCEEAFIPDKIITEIGKRFDYYGIPFDNFRVEPLYTDKGLWGYAMGLLVGDADFTTVKSKSERKRIGAFARQILVECHDFIDGVFVPHSNGYPYAYSRNGYFLFYRNSALSIEDIKEENGID